MKFIYILAWLLGVFSTFVIYIIIKKKKKNKSENLSTLANLSRYESKKYMGIVRMDIILYIPTREKMDDFDDLCDFIHKKFIRGEMKARDYYPSYEELTSLLLPIEGAENLVNVKKKLNLTDEEYENSFCKPKE